jgi:tyrosyl-tRNA synthetase
MKDRQALFIRNTISSTNDDVAVEYKEIRKELKRPLRIKLGIDPTGPLIHLGHCVLLERLRFLQEEGHEIIIIIGSFTAMIGDPANASAERPKLTPEEVALNYETYREQIGRVLDLTRTQFVFNNSWFDKFNLENTLELMSNITVSQMLQRRDFKERLELGLKLHEIMYPLLQAYDSVAIASDIELGGIDQLFNTQAGRSLQKLYGQRPQLVWYCNIITGTDGVQKMSKSLNNFIAVGDLNMFGKLMSIKDETMFEYIRELLVDLPELIALYEVPQPLEGGNLCHLKRALAHFLTNRYLGQKEADQQRRSFDKAAAIPTIEWKYSKSINLVDIIATLLPNESRSNIRRIVAQGGCRIQNQVVESLSYELSDEQQEILLAVGKFHKVKILFT